MTRFALNALCTLSLLAAFAALPLSAQAKSPQLQFTLEEAAMLTVEMQLDENDIFDMYYEGMIDEETTMLLMGFTAFEQEGKLSGTDLGSGRIKGVSGLDLGSGR